MVVSGFWEVLGVFGGATLVATAVAAYISKLIADRSIETKKGEIAISVENAKAALAKELEEYRSKLQREDLFFDKQVEVAKAFVALRHSLQPHYRPEMDWDEAVEEIAGCLETVEQRLNTFRLGYYHLLPQALREKIDHLTTRSMQEKFGDLGEGMISSEAWKAGEEVLEGLQEIEETLIRDLRP